MVGKDPGSREQGTTKVKSQEERDIRSIFVDFGYRRRQWKEEEGSLNNRHFYSKGFPMRGRWPFLLGAQSLFNANT